MQRIKTLASTSQYGYLKKKILPLGIERHIVHFVFNGVTRCGPHSPYLPYDATADFKEDAKNNMDLQKKTNR